MTEKKSKPVHFVSSEELLQDGRMNPRLVDRMEKVHTGTEIPSLLSRPLRASLPRVH